MGSTPYPVTVTIGHPKCLALIIFPRKDVLVIVVPQYCSGELISFSGFVSSFVAKVIYDEALSVCDYVFCKVYIEVVFHVNDTSGANGLMNIDRVEASWKDFSKYKIQLHVGLKYPGRCVDDNIAWETA